MSQKTFIAYLIDDIPIKFDSATILLATIISITIIPGILSIIALILEKCFKKSIIIKKIISWSSDVCSRGFLERIFVHVVRSKQEQDDDKRIYLENHSLCHRVNNKTILPYKNSTHLERIFAAFFIFQLLILSVITAEKLFTRREYFQKCTTYLNTFYNNNEYKCFVENQRKYTNMTAGGLFNPLWAFTLPEKIEVVQPYDYCKLASANNNSRNRRIDNDDTNIILGEMLEIRCIQFTFKWDNLIDTLTHVVEWHEILAFLFRKILQLALWWQTKLKHSNCWFNWKTNRTRKQILIVLLIIWSFIGVFILLEFISFLQIFIYFEFSGLETNILLFVPVLFLAIPYINWITLFRWYTTDYWKHNSKPTTDEEQKIDYYEKFRQTTLLIECEPGPHRNKSNGTISSRTSNRINVLTTAEKYFQMENNETSTNL
ncbi:unnamed protein product [Didymodactylos carnosus]|uniref:Uncharacterized protein n=1 Tax=Didymodactylos carnosus TaxID=1234261 RepID=A0A814I1B3_9BILA|nr:unnamed protein product [Didymodactylos carnosus]CAF1245951.1 unnamed protein product [Didymodactylos carnosus]CAF3788921.1 unnamed protein product [Didymodactylos carnosus]CAF4053418.1 unnamed protein product [Didymodactylos carnosus]